MKANGTRPAGAVAPMFRLLHGSGRRLIRGCGALIVVALVVGAVPVLAATVDITIPIETIIRGSAGSQHVLVVANVPVESQGETCQATAVARNQDSEHPNSDLLVSSETSVVILDVENTAYGTVFSGGLITLAETVTVTLTLGPDRVFSGGLDVEIDCPPFNPTTTTTTTTAPSPSVADSSITSAPPFDDISTSSTDDVIADVVATVLDTVITAPTSSVDVSGETLPFTGITQENMGGVAFALVALGGLMVLSVRRREAEVTVSRGWRTRIDCYRIEF